MGAVEMDGFSKQQLEALDKVQLVEQCLKLAGAVNQERKRANTYAEELRLAKEQNLAAQKQVEQEEEAITNKLMKRLEQLKKEKLLLATEVEAEEEFLTNTLQKKLEKLAKEKADLENRLEAEQEYIVNKLSKQLEQLEGEKAKLHRDKVELENQLEAEQEYIMNKLQKQVEKLGADKAALQRERAELARQVSDMGGAVERLNRDKVQLEQQMEVEEESIVNRLQRQLEALAGSYGALEQKLEARGISLREMGLAPTEMPAETWAYNRSRGTSRTGSGELSRSWGSVRSSELSKVLGSRRFTTERRSAGIGGGGQLGVDRPLSASSGGPSLVAGGSPDRLLPGGGDGAPHQAHGPPLSPI